jgi:hypothetical protein
LPDEFIDVVLSSTSATRSRFWPQIAVEVPDTGIERMPSTLMKAQGELVVPDTVTDGPDDE